MAGAVLDRLAQTETSEASPISKYIRIFLKMGALEVRTRAALKLGRLADAESAAHVLSQLSLPPARTTFTSLMLLAKPVDPVWGRVLLAHTFVAGGREAEAQPILEPALAHYRQIQIQGATDLEFRQHFARALYVQAMAEPAGHEGFAKRQLELSEAASELQALTDEARQLHDSKELMSWIDDAQKKPNAGQDAEQP
jgi:hypothetical protein